LHKPDECKLKDGKTAFPAETPDESRDDDNDDNSRIASGTSITSTRLASSIHMVAKHVAVSAVEAAARPADASFVRLRCALDPGSFDSRIGDVPFAITFCLRLPQQSYHQVTVTQASRGIFQMGQVICLRICDLEIRVRQNFRIRF